MYSASSEDGFDDSGFEASTRGEEGRCGMRNGKLDSVMILNLALLYSQSETYTARK